MSDDVRAKRLAALREGHICSNWWECETCQRRLAEIEAKYPLTTQDGHP